MNLSELSVAQWYAAISGAIRDGEIEAAAQLIALMAIHGHPSEADEMRRVILLLRAEP